MIGAPLSDGQDYDTGVDKAPEALREGGIKAVVEAIDWRFEDKGDLNFNDLADKPSHCMCSRHTMVIARWASTRMITITMGINPNYTCIRSSTHYTRYSRTS
mmetsp:Transcript_13330/g.11175  ORF Transcript_13330/g.11175 Transcript_13330/m.11175 type:complete len:102 (+) Transcript_13330:25-330(+)